METAQEGRAGISDAGGTTFEMRDATVVDPGGTFEAPSFFFEGPDRYVDNHDAGFAGRGGHFDFPSATISDPGNIVVTRHTSFIGDNPSYDMCNADLTGKENGSRGLLTSASERVTVSRTVGRLSPCVTRVSIDFR